jgi:hypothetical protein
MRDALLYGLNATNTRLFQSLEDVTEAEAQRAPVAGLSPIIWQAGHLALADFDFARRADGTLTAPAGYAGLFKPGPGTGGERAYPSLTEVKDVLRRAQQTLEGIARTADLNAAIDTPNYKTVGEMLVFVQYHRGYHIGKIMTLRALLKKPLIR